MTWSDQPVLVTGATGFVGGHLCRLLVDFGARVHGVGRSQIASIDLPGVSYHSGDLADAPFVDSLFSEVRPQCVFHLASHVVGARDLEQVAATLRDGLVATVNVLTAAARHDRPRIVLAGSLEEPETDDGPLVPSSPYAAAKMAGAAYARMFHALYGLPVVHARIFMVYGPGQLDLRKLIPYTILSLLRGEAPLLSNGERLVDWVYVEDVARGLITLGEKSGIEGQRIDLGTGVLTSVREVVLQVAQLVRPDIMPHFGAVEGRPMEQVRRADADAAQRATGWAPEVALPEGLRRTVDWYANLVTEPGHQS
jgi:UDP-glucose 4-epimerase